MSQNGKGDKRCPTDWKKWDSGFDYIKWGKRLPRRKAARKRRKRRKADIFSASVGLLSSLY